MSLQEYINLQLPKSETVQEYSDRTNTQVGIARMYLPIRYNVGIEDDIIKSTRDGPVTVKRDQPINSEKWSMSDIRLIIESNEPKIGEKFQKYIFRLIGQYHRNSERILKIVFQNYDIKMDENHLRIYPLNGDKIVRMYMKYNTIKIEESTGLVISNQISNLKLKNYIASSKKNLTVSSIKNYLPGTKPKKGLREKIVGQKMIELIKHNKPSMGQSVLSYYREISGQNDVLNKYASEFKNLVIAIHKDISSIECRKLHIFIESPDDIPSV